MEKSCRLFVLLFFSEWKNQEMERDGKSPAIPFAIFVHVIYNRSRTQKEAAMGSKATVTYYHHSGFTVAIGETLMGFDYWRGENGELTGSDQLVSLPLIHALTQRGKHFGKFSTQTSFLFL